MEVGVNLLALAAVGALVVVPLGREYRDFRASWNLSRLGALMTTLLVVPAFAVALAVSLPLAEMPAAQWTATVLVTLAAYSVGTSAVRTAVAPAQSH